MTDDNHHESRGYMKSGAAWSVDTKPSSDGGTYTVMARACDPEPLAAGALPRPRLTADEAASQFKSYPGVAGVEDMPHKLLAFLADAGADSTAKIQHIVWNDGSSAIIAEIGERHPLPWAEFYERARQHMTWCAARPRGSIDSN